MPRLGFLAVTFGDGVCRVFDVPVPNAFESKEENCPIFSKSHLKIAMNRISLIGATKFNAVNLFLKRPCPTPSCGRSTGWISQLL